VVLESNEWEGKAGVAAEPELEGDVESGLRKSLARSTHLGGATTGSTGARDGGEGGVADVGELGGVTDGSPVALAVLMGHGKLVPDVHPVTVLAINALATNLNLNLGDHLLADVVKPTSIHGGAAGHILVDLGEDNLEVGAVAKITVTGDRAGNTATEVGLARESLLNRLHGKVGVASVRHLPESDLRGSGEEDVLGSVSDKLHKCSSHGCGFCVIYYTKKKIWRILLNKK
jgi:hypothetical protein